MNFETLTESQASKKPVALVPQLHVCLALPRGITHGLLLSAELLARGGRFVLEEVVNHGSAALSEGLFAGRGVA